VTCVLYVGLSSDICALYLRAYVRYMRAYKVTCLRSLWARDMFVLYVLCRTFAFATGATVFNTDGSLRGANLDPFPGWTYQNKTMVRVFLKMLNATMSECVCMCSQFLDVRCVFMTVNFRWMRAECCATLTACMNSRYVEEDSCRSVLD
jgi:hypothetical protein